MQEPKLLSQLIADPTGKILLSFLKTRPDEWATRQMEARYRVLPPAEDEVGDHPARICYDLLCLEYQSLRGCFDREGMLMPLCLSRLCMSQCNKPIAEGYGWDFKADGTPNVAVVAFKSTMISCSRITYQKPISRHGQTSDASGLARMVRSAHFTRAESYSFEPVKYAVRGESGKKELCELTGGEAAKRWVSMRTMVFLIQQGYSAQVAWETSKCLETFGPFGT